MKIGTIDTDQRVMVVAEIGNNHEGDRALAERMVREAAAAGVDAVKFQTIVPERLVSVQEQARIEQLKRFQLGYDAFAVLSRVAREEGLLFFSTPFDLESADALAPMVDAYKIASGDNTFYPLIERVCRTGKPLMVSLGLTEWEQAVHIHDFIRTQWDTHGVHQDVALLHCVCAYPAPEDETNLAVIRRLAEIGDTVGYSDHTMGVDAAVLSVAFGARIVEKHFTVDKNYSPFRDHQLSADPGEMAELVRRIRQVETLAGSREKQVNACEEGNRIPVRRSVVAARDLEAGCTICIDDLGWVRPGGGLAPGDEALLVGRSLDRAVRSGEMILKDYLRD